MNPKRILIVPDSFKGTLSSPEVANCVAEGFCEVFPELEAIRRPLADGGEGSTECIGSQLGAERVELTVSGPEGDDVTGFYYRLGEEQAFVELAAGSGLTQVRTNAIPPLARSTFGFGELIRHAIESGAKDITVFLGGSATTDCGVGAAAALGVQFLDSAGRSVFEKDTLRSGIDLSRIAEVRFEESICSGVKIRAACDVDNPLTGPRGAAAIYGPQKGLKPADIEIADRNFNNLTAIVAEKLGSGYLSDETPGCGAAGGAGFGVLNLLGGELVSGPEFFLDLIEFDRLAGSVDLIITGEGKLDRQSIEGKLLSRLIRRNPGKPLLSLCGVIDVSTEELRTYPTLTPFGLGQVSAMTNPAESLRILATEVAKLIKL